MALAVNLFHCACSEVAELLGNYGHCIIPQGKILWTCQSVDWRPHDSTIRDLHMELVGPCDNDVRMKQSHADQEAQRSGD